MLTKCVTFDVWAYRSGLKVNYSNLKKIPCPMLKRITQNIGIHTNVTLGKPFVLLFKTSPLVIIPWRTKLAKVAPNSHHLRELYIFPQTPTKVP